MTIDAKQIELTDEQKRLLAEAANHAGRPWPEVFSEAFSAHQIPRERIAAASPKSFYDALLEDGALGVVNDGLPIDLSTNPEHMEDFGRDHPAGAN